MIHVIFNCCIYVVELMSFDFKIKSENGYIRPDLFIEPLLPHKPSAANAAKRVCAVTPQRSFNSQGMDITQGPCTR